MYYIYHIPGKKIGVTRNLNNRVTLIQGYKENEYEVLEQSDDIDYISDREIELQKSYGYKVDRKLYKHLFKNMNINATQQTSTFPCPVNKLKGRLHDNIGLTWHTEFGQFEITKRNIPWIMANVKESMYNSNRCYVYNKAFYESFFNPEHTVKSGTYTKLKPNMSDNRSINKGITYFNKLKSLDHVQAIIVKNNTILAIEDQQGTKKMLSKLKKKSEGILIKLPKKKQDLRMDLPTIGLQTLKDCKKYGLKGIVLSSKKNIFLDKDKCISFANKNKIFIKII